jgi:hypothetical protein
LTAGIKQYSFEKFYRKRRRLSNDPNQIMRFFRTRAEPPDPTVETLRIIARLRADWRPSAAELSDTAVLEQWRLYRGQPYMLQGWTASSLKSGVAFAFDLDAGWARLIDRWVRLGAPNVAPPRVTNDEVMEAAALSFVEGASTRALDIAEEARTLASQARGAGLGMAAYLLDVAAMEVDAARSRRQRRADARVVRIEDWRHPGSA